MEASVSSTEANEGQATAGFWSLTLGSIGVVFGDIGTSPLYAFRTAVADAAHGEPVTVAAPAANRRKACFIRNDLFVSHWRRIERCAAAFPSSD